MELTTEEIPKTRRRKRPDIPWKFIGVCIVIFFSCLAGGYYYASWTREAVSGEKPIQPLKINSSLNQKNYLIVQYSQSAAPKAEIQAAWYVFYSTSPTPTIFFRPVILTTASGPSRSLPENFLSGESGQLTTSSLAELNAGQIRLDGYFLISDVKIKNLFTTFVSGLKSPGETSGVVEKEWNLVDPESMRSICTAIQTKNSYFFDVLQSMQNSEGFQIFSSQNQKLDLPLSEKNSKNKEVICKTVVD